jgi:hypothetical protein
MLGVLYAVNEEFRQKRGSGQVSKNKINEPYRHCSTTCSRDDGIACCRVLWRINFSSYSGCALWFPKLIVDWDCDNRRLGPLLILL